jgi:hypothetical protein
MKNFERMSEKKRHNKETHPEKGTRSYNRNEKIINNNTALKKARDIAQGLQKPDSAYSSPGGKGSTYRPGNHSQDYKDNWEKIFGNKNKQSEPKRRYKLKVNGVYVDQDKPDPASDPYDNDEYSRSHDEDD